MYTTRLHYPIFKIDDTGEARDNILSQAVAEIDPLYFETNPRFKGMGKSSSPILVDCMLVYEEGDRWDLTIVRVLDTNGQSKYLFLPLVADIESEMTTKISQFVPIDLGDVAFGLETHSQLMGTRNWKVVDAFSDFGFIMKLINLFLSRERLDPNHPNAYTEIRDRGIGRFVFHFSPDFQKGWKHSFGIGILPEHTETGEISLEYGGLYRLVINSILPTATDIVSLQSAPNVAGWIIYSGPQTPDLLIGVLEKSQNGES
jgi:hypothetical protein